MDISLKKRMKVEPIGYLGIFASTILGFAFIFFVCQFLPSSAPESANAGLLPLSIAYVMGFIFSTFQLALTIFLCVQRSNFNKSRKASQP